MNNVVRQYLCQILRTHGTEILDDVPRLQQLLSEMCGPLQDECQLLMTALYYQVPRQLLARGDKESWPTLRPHLVEQFSQTAFLNPESAGWAIDSWRGGLIAGGGLGSPLRKEKAGAPTSLPTLPSMHGEFPEIHPQSEPPVLQPPPLQMAEPAEPIAATLPPGAQLPFLAPSGRLPGRTPKGSRPVPVAEQTMTAIPLETPALDPFAEQRVGPPPPTPPAMPVLFPEPPVIPPPVPLMTPPPLPVGDVLGGMAIPVIPPPPPGWETPMPSPPMTPPAPPAWHGPTPPAQPAWRGTTSQLPPPRRKVGLVVAGLLAFVLLNGLIVAGVFAWKHWHKPHEPAIAEKTEPSTQPTGRTAPTGTTGRTGTTGTTETTGPVRPPKPDPALQERLAQAKRHVEQGDRYFSNNAYDLALQEYNRALGFDPDCASAFHGRGQVYLEQRLYTRAIKDLDDAIKRDPRMIDAYLARSVAYYNQNKYDETIKDCNEVLKLDRKVPAAYNNRGLAYMGQNKIPQALADFDEALAIRSNYGRAWANRGQCHFRLADYDKALEDLANAVQHDRTLGYAYNIRGQIFMMRKQYSQAAAEFSEAIRTNRNIAVYWSNRALAYLCQDDYTHCIQDADEAIQREVSHSSAYCWRGECYRRRNQLDLALRDLTRALEYNRTSPWAYYYRGCVRLDQMRTDEAITDFRLALKYDPTHEAARAELAWQTGRGLLKYVSDDTEAFLCVNVRQLCQTHVVRTNYLPQWQKTLSDSPVQALLKLIGVDPFNDLDQVLFAGYRDSLRVAKFEVVLRGTFNEDKLRTFARQAMQDRSLRDLLAGQCEIYEYRAPQATDSVFAALINKQTLVLSSSIDAVREAFHRERVQRRSSLKNRVLQYMLDDLDGRRTVWMAFGSEALLATGADQDLFKRLDAFTGTVEVSQGAMLNVVFHAITAKDARDLAANLRKSLLDSTSTLKNQKQMAPVLEFIRALTVKAQDESILIHGQVDERTLTQMVDLLIAEMTKSSTKK